MDGNVSFVQLQKKTSKHRKSVMMKEGGKCVGRADLEFFFKLSDL